MSGLLLMRVVLLPRAERERVDGLAGIDGLARARDEAGLEQLDHAVDHHLGVDAEILDARLLEHRADRVRHAADADLQARAVLDLGGDEGGDACGRSRRPAGWSAR